MDDDFFLSLQDEEEVDGNEGKKDEGPKKLEFDAVIQEEGWFYNAGARGERVEVLKNQADLCFYKGQYERVLEYFAQAMEMNLGKLGNKEWLDLYCRSLQRMGRSADALEHARTRAELDRGYDFYGHWLLADLLRDCKQYEEAIIAAQKCLTVQSAVSDLWFFLGNLYLEMEPKHPENNILAALALIRARSWTLTGIRKSTGFPVESMKAFLVRVEDALAMTSVAPPSAWCEAGRSALEAQLKELRKDTFGDEPVQAGSRRGHLTDPQVMANFMSRTDFEKRWFSRDITLPEDDVAEGDDAITAVPQ